MKHREIVSIALFAILALLVVPVFPHFPSPNEYSRWIIDVALVDFHSIEVTPVIRATGIPFTDLAVKDGRTYSNKAPGSSLLVLPVYAAMRAFTGPPSIANMRLTLNVMRIFGATLPAILLALWFARVARRLGIGDDRIAIAVATMLFATPLFTYGLLFFSHAITALALFGAWVLLFINRNEYFAGALIGIAVLTEFPAAIPAVVMIACAIPVIRAPGLLRVIAGGAPFAIILGVYDTLAFGGPLELPVYHVIEENIREADRGGFFGLRPPSMTYLTDMLIGSSKGLLVLSPILLIALAGLPAARKKLSTPAFLAMILVPAAIVLTIAGYPFWYGGRGVGVRYLIPMMPFLAMLIAFAAETFIEAILLGASVATLALLTLVFPFVPTIYPVPWVSFSLPLLRNGSVVPNLLHLASPPLAIVVPFALVTGAVVAAVRPRRIAFLAIGAALWIAIGFVAEMRKPSEPYLRIVVEEVNFEHRGAIVRSLPPGHPAIPSLTTRAEELRRLPPAKWPQ